MAIFNSLGSNYSLTETLLPFWPQSHAAIKVKKTLASMFHQHVHFTYKGRDAITLALQSIGIKSKEVVLTQALACSAVETGIRRTGANVQYLDLKPNSLSINLPSTTTAKALIVQHLFGYPDDIVNIISWCKKNHVLLIEDLAQSLGGEVGKSGDAIVLSFGRDKMVDGVSGGAVVFNNVIPTCLPARQGVVRDLTYPLLTYIIRSTYEIGIGKLLHKLLTGTGWFYSPTLSPTPEISSLPTLYFPLINSQLKNLDVSVQHRRQITQYYFDHLPISTRLITQAQINKGSCLRYPIIINDLSSIISNLKSNQIFLEDRWYRSPVDSGKIPFQSVYQPGSCPNAESLSKRLFNLPTHRYINQEIASKICQLINL